MSLNFFSRKELHSLEKPVIEIARQAAKRIMQIYDAGFSIENKQDNSPLTDADLAANQTIIDGLSSLTPDIPILSEESCDISFEQRQQWHRYWLVDPLDGTKEFIKRNGEFTVNIALIENHKSILGVVFIPVTGKYYFASSKNGAFRSNNNKTPQRIFCTSQKRRPVLVAGSRSHASDGLNNFLSNLGEHKISSLGSSLKMCMVAEGSIDIYPRIGLTSEWDTAASQCIVEESGGWLTDLDMQPLQYNSKESLLNPHFFVFGDAEENWAQYLN